jgi:MscS family membrane protein
MSLQTVFLGNTLHQLLVYALLLAGSVLVGKAISWTLKQFIKSFAHKTTTKADDVIVDVLEGPLVFAIFVATFALSERLLTLSPGALGIYDAIVRMFITFTIAWFLIRFLDSVIVHYVNPLAAKSESDLDDVLVPILQTAAKVVVIAIAGVMILSDFGFNVTGLIAGLGIGGLAFAFAAKDLIANVFGGVSVLTDKPFKLGDMIKFDSKQGKVTQIGIRTTRIETLDGTHLIVPNAKFTDGIIENVTKRNKHRVTLVLGLEYGTSTKKLKEAKELLVKMIKKHKGTSDDCTVFFSNFNTSSLDLTVHYFVTDLKRIAETQDEINMLIKEGFEKAKLNFAYPTTTVIVKK